MVQKNICDKCRHKWEIDFSNPESNNICPNCGNTELKSTRSGLLGQVQRLLATAYKDNQLPRILVMENVKNLVGKKFKPQFDAWVKWLDSIGYNTYYKVLNAKHYGVCQNRERVFAISIRKDIDTNGFTFPEPIPLTTRLKDILEHNVDEKYYLPDDRIEKILNSSFMQEKKRIQTTDVCDTLLARDWKDPKCVPVEEPQVKQIGNVCPTKTRSNPNQGRVYDKDGIAPSLTTMEGGNREPMVIEQEPFIVASRGRNPENPSDRTTGAPTEQRLEPNFSGTTNCLTSVAKDNYVCEPQVLRAERTEYGKAIRKQYEAGEVDEKISNMREMRPRTDGVSNTITTLLKDNYVAEPVIVEDFYQSREPRVYSDVAPTLRSERSGLKVADEVEYPCSTRGKQVASAIRASIYKQGARNLEENVANGLGYEGVIEKEEPKIRWRIRKLTPKETTRLMNFTDKDYEAMAKYVSNSAIYKANGNSIVVACLIAIFSSLFLEDGYKSDVWTKYSLNYWD